MTASPPTPDSEATGISPWSIWEEAGLPCRVIALTQHGEVHGYLLRIVQGKGRVAWGTPSGRVRHCLAGPDDLQQPSGARPWEGSEIPGLSVLGL